jgi:hypothetical protein
VINKRLNNQKSVSKCLLDDRGNTVCHVCSGTVLTPIVLSQPGKHQSSSPYGQHQITIPHLNMAQVLADTDNACKNTKHVLAKFSEAFSKFQKIFGAINLCCPKNKWFIFSFEKKDYYFFESWCKRSISNFILMIEKC